MNPILMSMIFATTIGAGLWIANGFFTNIETDNYSIQEYKKADKILKKAEQIQSLHDVQALYSKKISYGNVYSLPMIQNKPFSSLIINPQNVNAEIINKYATAILKLLEIYPNARDSYFTCPVLATTGSITENECEIVKGKEFNFYALSDGKIQYKTSTSLVEKTNIIDTNRKFNLNKEVSLDGNDTVVKKKLILPTKSFNAQNKKVFSIIEKAEKYMNEKRYELATQSLSNIDKANIKSPRAVLLRVEIVKRQLLDNSTVNYTTINNKKFFLIASQDISKVSQGIKDSIVKAISQTGEIGMYEYNNNAEGKSLLLLIKSDLQLNPENYVNVTSSQKAKFLSNLSYLS